MASEAQVKEFITKNFPSYAWVIGVPELFKLFQDAYSPSGVSTMSQAILQSKLEATTWWKSNGQSVRQYIALEQTDPETLAEKIRNKEAEIHQQANLMGLSDSQINIQDVARRAIRLGWDNNQLKEQLAGMVQFNPDNAGSDHTGLIDTTIADLKGAASAYMVKLDDPTAFQWARDVAAGHRTADDYNTVMRDWAKGRFPTLAEIIDGGITPNQYFQPIQREVADLLEVPPESIDLANDPKFAQITSYIDPKTNVPRPMSISEAQRFTRGLGEWRQTRQGQQVAAKGINGMLKIFGKVA